MVRDSARSSYYSSKKTLNLPFPELVPDIGMELLVQRLESPPRLVHLLNKCVGLILADKHLSAVAEAVQPGRLVQEVDQSAWREMKQLILVSDRAICEFDSLKVHLPHLLS